MFCPSICTVRILSSTRQVPVATGVRALAVTIQRSAEPFARNIKFSSLGSPNGTVVLRQCPTKAAEFEFLRVHWELRHCRERGHGAPKVLGA